MSRASRVQSGRQARVVRNREFATDREWPGVRSGSRVGGRNRKTGIAPVVTEIVRSASNLPRCSRAANLYVLARRLQTAFEDSGDLDAAATSLARATRESLLTDEWACLDRLVTGLRRRLRR